MVYTSASLSLAAMEVFVNLTAAQEPGDLISLCVGLPLDETKVEEEKRELLLQLPFDWRRVGQRDLQRMGDEWIHSGRSLTMMVPSAVIDGEWNVLVNPVHPDAVKIEMEEPKPFRFDPRMFKTTS